VRQDRLKVHHAELGAFKSFVVGICVFSLGSVLAGWLNQHNVHGWLALIDNILTGIVAGLVALSYERLRHRDIEKKLQTIRMMNHHVRNALQIVSAFSANLDGTEQGMRVHDAVRRIEWALREVLPGKIDLSDAAALPNSKMSANNSPAL